MIREQIRDRAHEREQFLPDSYGQNAATRFARVKKVPNRRTRRASLFHQ
jgi:hypothetical protein